MYYLKKSLSTAMPSHEQNLELFQLLETAQCRISEIKANPDALPAELKQWERTAEKAREQLILANQGLVASVARKYANSGQDAEDFISAGTIGLIKAIEGFDYRLGNQLSTYATWWIRQAITRSPMTQPAFRIPEGRRVELRKVNELIAELTKEYGRKPLAADIANVMGIPADKAYELCVAATLSLVSIDSPLGDDEGANYHDVIRDRSSQDPFEAAERADMLELVDQAAKTLTEIEREIFQMHLLEGLTFETIGRSYGRSGERIRQVYNTAFEKVRAYVNAKDRKTPTPVIQTVAAGIVKQIPAPVAKSRGFYLKMRAVEKNPNHHIWNNNGTWYCNFTLVSESGKESRVRNPLYTDNVEDARRRRDKMILLYNGLSDAAA